MSKGGRLVDPFPEVDGGREGAREGREVESDVGR